MIFYFSNQVFVIAVKTGEILDYEVRSLICQECSSHEQWDKLLPAYLEWKESHRPQCQVNHEGFSEEMEAQGAVEIFGRSIEKRGLMYCVCWSWR